MSTISNTRGNQFKMQLTHIHYNLQNNFYSNRIIAAWNSLPNDIVSVSNIFKKRLDKFWFNQDLKFDWKADITRSEVVG